MIDGTGHPPHWTGSSFFGLYPALVTDIVDPDRLARVEVRFPWLGDGGSDVRAWATLLTPYADDDQGFVALPAVGTQVVVGFEAGDLGRPYVVGSCWNGREMMPVTPTRPNDKRVLKSRSGAVLEFDDSAVAPKVTLSSRDGHRVVLDDGARTLQVTHADGSTVTLSASGQISLRANATVEVTACALNVHAATAVFDGMVSCTNLVASVGVVSPSYTPGAGNVW
ncbi:phage baseplate assembly protein V [Modestobacter altitudinis]|uniref:phage baseplate assembly protein V n=1 Tax=Modestobacter altitudinis TaxID=2213158 RepID=UPI00110D102C|nr:phage baseplate assembly protein V [Modestobacter altitudinis]